MREEIDFEIVDFRNFDSLVTLTLTFDDLKTHIVRFVSSTFIHSTFHHVAPLSFIQTDGRTDISSGFIRSSHKRNDLIIIFRISVAHNVIIKSLSQALRAE